MSKSVIQEAHEIIYGDREQSYGHPARNITHISQQWRLYLDQKFGVDVPLTAEDVCWMMADLKKVRQMNTASRDNLVDAIGYVGLVGRLDE